MAEFRGENVAVSNGGALAASAVVKATPGTVYTVVFTNTNVAARWLQLYNATAVPADTAVPFISIPVAAGASVTLDFGLYGLPFSTGICVANSSTAATKTVGAADSFFCVTYV